MTRAAFSIKNDKKKNHIKIINDFLIKNEFLDKTINSFFDKRYNKTIYLISDAIMNDNDIKNELPLIMGDNNDRWHGNL